MEFAGDLMLQLMIAYRSLNGLMTELLEASDIAQHYQLLVVLCRIGGAATQIELIRYLKGNESTVRASIKVLERNGFLVRNKSNKDRRSHTILITDQTRKLLIKIEAVFKEVDHVAFVGIDQDELFNLWKTVIRINENIDKLS